MTARPMTELLERAREIAADDLSAMTASWTDTQAFARALLDASSAERGLREALEKVTQLCRRMHQDEEPASAPHDLVEAEQLLAALTSKEEG